MTISALLLLLPLASATLILLVTRKLGAVSSLVSTGSVVATFVLSLLYLGAADGDGILFPWISVGDFALDIGVRTDDLSRGMMLVVTFVGMLVHIYSLGYMKDDEAKARYFACLSLFMFSMTGIVLANNFAMMFIFWELVGVSSYLLIGHWFGRPTASEAAKKAFLTNRIGDFGFMVGILMLWALTGAVNFGALEEALPGVASASPALVTIAALCVFCGAVGKSAQFPLHVWLPDAMEGPTPVSALIHAATMVAAGVYMLVRVDFLIGASATAAQVIAWVGAVTAVLAALMATQQNDIKKILAYSTLSQLGYMVMAVGCLAFSAAMFHLFTHAFFKALLFLGAGAVIHACHHEQDIWKMGGLRSRMPVTFWTFIVGTAALVAFPYVTSGFYSKEMILEAAHGEHGSEPLFILAAAVAVLTPFYMVRLVMAAFFGTPRTDAASHAHEVPPVMALPLIVLAVPSVIAGFGFFAHPILGENFPEAHASTVILMTSIATLVAGAGLAILLYRGRSRDPLSIPPFARKFYLDELYLGLIRVFQDGVAVVARFLDDYVIGGLLVRGGSSAVAGLGGLLRRLQVGNLQGYAFLFALGVILVIYFAVFS